MCKSFVGINLIFFIYRCNDDRIVPCLADSADALSSERQHSANVLSILAAVLALAILLIALLGGGVYLIK